MKVFVSTSNGKFFCPIDGCPKAFDEDKSNSLRRHCKRSHNITVSTYEKEDIPIEVLRERQRGYTARYRDKKHPRKRKARYKKKIYSSLTFKDANRRGAFGCRNPIVEYKTSNIKGAGNGIFALQDLREGDLVTWVSGKKSKIIPTDSSYSINMDDKSVFNGIRSPKKGKGMGSFVNREDRKISRSRKNCAIVVCKGQKHELYLEITRPVKEGQELYTTYSKAYRIKKM